MELQVGQWARWSKSESSLSSLTLDAMFMRVKLPRTKYLVADDSNLIPLNAQLPGKDSLVVAAIATSSIEAQKLSSLLMKKDENLASQQTDA